MIKTLLYGLTICLSLSILVVFWISDGFRDFGASQEKPFMPLVWGIVLFAVVFEPLLLSDFMEKRLRSKSYTNLTTRGVIAGVTIFGVCGCLYYVGLKLKAYELILILIGYAFAVGIGIFGITAGRTRNPSLDLNS